MSNIGALVPKRDIHNLLGCLCDNPQLLLEDKEIKLDNKMFGENLYKIIFGAINNIIVNNINIKKITPVDIDNEIAKVPKNYKFCEDNNGFLFIKSFCNHFNLDIFKSNYNRIKKFALLRDLHDIGVDVSDIYDYETIVLEKQKIQNEKLENMELNDIINVINGKLAGIKTKWEVEGGYESHMVGEGLDTLLQRLHSKPEYGYPYFNGYYNAIFRGMKKRKLVIRSAGTGVGKTRLALADIASISAKEIYNLENKKWISNGEVRASDFISTELQIEELQTCLIAIISGVAEDIIKAGNFTADVYERVHHAIDILKESPIYLHEIEDFSIDDIETILESDILKHDVEYCFFDYIQVVPKLSLTLQEAFGMGLREDQIIVNLANRLKNIANKYNIYLSTSTQLNRTAKEHENRDATAIRGGMSVADKADIGILCFRVTERDKRNLDHILKNSQFLTPNFCHYIYKHRGGKNSIIIWTILNSANVRETMCFCTTMDFELLGDIQPLDINFKEPEKKINCFGR